MGGFILVWFEGDVEKAFADLATNDSEFVTWFRGRVLDTHEIHWLIERRKSAHHGDDE